MKNTMPKQLISSTDQVEVSKFRPHGRVEVTCDFPILHCTAIGPFNEELVSVLTPVLLPFYTAMAEQGAWGEIYYFRESALASPETLKSLNALIKEVNRRGISPSATAYVIGPEIEGGSLMAKPFEKCFSDTGRRFKIFEKSDDAMAWVLSILAEGHT